MALEIDIKSLKGLEREKVLEVLHRDEILRKAEQERIRKLKSGYQEIRRKGAKISSREYSSQSCARCQNTLGLVFNVGVVCSICNHKVCRECCVHKSDRVWRCTLCHAHWQMKVKSGEWFIEERAKKFHQEQGKHETISEKLLHTFRTLSNIAIVPPTPPPVGCLLEEKHSKGFTRSMENLFWSLTGHIKQISKSQEDVMKGSKLLTADYGKEDCELKKERRSLSDTALVNSCKLSASASLLRVSKQDEKDGGTLQEVDLQHTEEVNSTSNQLDPIRSQVPTQHEIPQWGGVYSITNTCMEPETLDNANVTGEIELSIQYNFKAVALEIHIKACKKLAYGDEKKKKCNPYVKTYLLPDKSPQSKLKSTVKKNSVNPVFNETLRYNIERSQLEMRTLQVSVWHCTTLKRKVFLGELQIPFEDWKFEDNSTQSYKWYQLQDKIMPVHDPGLH
ncbi:synaptotagmin-like protein 3 isoform X1 [Carcharodon carcharias]|uniref:synaptotagmin-like protein 3 isoform X1 n=1 Tax=Carcharodon carcharias TaxID=13397 RepID=UPI001B7E9A83|nr:synaptotagmin-like protein 3 isoform X1 [Carcharodon carcharias]XP_041059862.1 synaptotagmin-like protein 3 isoform X1 [Carcharodon carcharias]XP_041059872.1 synaptotagmin-like protein 3 isoform X1 [Carcharodon carcharias]XP_041059883.1 synaptotagmin-like protein 3 isoform X1 [Carcharodon carcharias]